MLTLSPLAAGGATLIPGSGQPGPGQDAVDPTAAAGFLAALLQHGLALAAPPTAPQPAGAGTAAVGAIGATTPTPLQGAGLTGQTTGPALAVALVPGPPSAPIETGAATAPVKPAVASTLFKPAAISTPVETASADASPEGLPPAAPVAMLAIDVAGSSAERAGSTPTAPGSAEPVKQVPSPMAGVDANGQLKPSQTKPPSRSALDAASTSASAGRMPAALRGLVDVQAGADRGAPEPPAVPAAATPSATASAAASLAVPATTPVPGPAKPTATSGKGGVEADDDGAAAADPIAATGKSADATVATTASKAVSAKTHDPSESPISSPSPAAGSAAQAATSQAPGQEHVEASTRSPETRAATVPATPVALASEIVRTVHHGADRLQLDLMPESLGRVRVEVAVDDNGRVRAAFAVDRPDTLQLLQRDTRGLTQALSAAGMPVADGGLSFSLRQDGGGNNNAQAAWQQRALPPQADDTAAKTRQLPPAPRTRAAGVGQLDLTV